MTRFIRLLIISTFPLFNSILTYTPISLDHKTHAEQWITHFTEKTQPKDIQLASNMLYLLYANGLIDTKIHQLIIPITRLTQTIRNNIANYKTTTNELSILKTLTDRLSFVIGARVIYNKALEVCLNYCNKNMSFEAHNAMLILEEYGQNELNKYAQENSSEMSQRLESSLEIINTEIKSLETIANFYTAIANGTHAELLAKNEPTDNLIAIKVLDQLHRGNKIATQHTEYLLNTFDESTESITNLYSCAIEILKLHYQELHTYLLSNDYNKAYSTTLFGMNDLLPEEYQSVLPTVELVFEHILKTIKMYTKIELISQTQKESQ